MGVMKKVTISRLEQLKNKANFEDEEGNLYLVRCMNCEGNRGRENYAMAVSSGSCAWCGWSEKESDN